MDLCKHDPHTWQAYFRGCELFQYECPGREYDAFTPIF